MIFHVLEIECQWYHKGCAIRAAERGDDRLLSVDRDRDVGRSFADASTNTEPATVVGTAITWNLATYVHDEKSATVNLTDQVVADTVTMIVDTVVSWSFATEVDDTDSVAAILVDEVVGDTVTMIVDTVVTWDDRLPCDHVKIVHEQRTENITPVFNDNRNFDKGDAPNNPSSYSIVDYSKIQNIETKFAEGKFSTDNSKKIIHCDSTDFYVMFHVFVM
jgi:hypothetical protein